MSKKLFFITGRGRSGTWLLKSILDTHPKISVAPESIFILQFYSKYGKLKKWNNNAIQKFIEDLSKDEKIVAWWNINFKELEEFLLRAECHSFQDACRLVYEFYALANKKESLVVLGDKNPEYALKMIKLHDIFPESEFIVLTRDPRDNIHSYMNVNFDLNNPYSLAARWNFYHRRIFSAQAQLPRRILIIRYEDLISQPEKCLNNICERIGVPYDPRILDFHKNPKNVFSWNEKIQQKLSIGNIFKWKKMESQISNKKISKLCSDFSQRLDYEVSNEANISIIEFIQYFRGYLVSYCELLFYLLPLNLKQKVLSFYRQKTKIFRVYE